MPMTVRRGLMAMSLVLALGPGCGEKAAPPSSSGTGGQPTLPGAGGTPGATGTGGTPGAAGTGGTPGAAGTGGTPGAAGAGGTLGPAQPLVAKPVTVALTAAQKAEADRLRALLADAKSLSGEQLRARRKPTFRASLGYDPLKAINYDLLQRSALKLDSAESTILASKGFVVSDKRRFPHFGYGYKTIYSQDLPVFISADSILQAVHQSYDKILMALELEGMRPQLEALLAGMESRLGSAKDLAPAVRADVRLYLGVARALLRGERVSDPPEAAKLFDSATKASAPEDLELFGSKRIIDFSQFAPRGHYKGYPELERYFRAMMWLGRIDLPLLQTDPATGQQLLVRHSVAMALALRGLMDEAAVARWNKLDAVVRAFVGEPDSMSPADVDRLKTDLGVTGNDVAPVSDEALARALVAGAYGTQRILSQYVAQASHEGTWPLDATFLFFGQRYVFDSHVLSNVVYDRVPAKDDKYRMMPSPLDAAFAALRNDQAAHLLVAELDRYPGYPGALESIRRLGDEHGAAFWEANLYNIWLGALRALSPGVDLASGSGLPAVATTEAWGRRLLNTQLASWAQLRRDTILYAKQSYTTGVACEFPDAYVEPYPAFFAQIEKFAQKGEAVAAQLPLPTTDTLGPRVKTYFAKLRQVAGTLRAMAEHQRSGQPHTAEHLAFVNRAVDLDLGCGGPAGIRGWYADLFFESGDAASFDPNVADVHTQPTDESGTPVGRVLHVGTGWPRLMVMTVDTCAGPRAYAGVVSSYHETITMNFERLDDQAWATRFRGQNGAGTAPPDVPWMTDVIAK